MGVDMETDRELLELAARAAGLTTMWSEPFKRYERFVLEKYRGAWDPLTDDGDAMRLAVKLKIRIGFRPCAYADTPSGVRFFGAHEGDDADARTRRAIVRAAARIGRET